jgi:hypothetical protein
MSESQAGSTIDLVRWTFTPESSKRTEIETHLNELGLEVHVHADGRFTVLWDEPEGDIDEVVEELWEVNGGPFEITHEEYRHLSHNVYHAEGEDLADDRTVA